MATSPKQGVWIPTKQGVEFVNGNLLVPHCITIRNPDTLVGFSDSYVDINAVLATSVDEANLRWRDS